MVVCAGYNIRDPKIQQETDLPILAEAPCCNPQRLVLYIWGIFGEILMFGIGMPELLIILGLALVILGPKKLPDLAKGLGRAMREFKNATDEMKENFREETGELEEIKDSVVKEIDRAMEPGDEGEEPLESEKDAETTVEEDEAGKAAEDAKNSDQVKHGDGGKESTEEAEKSPPG